MNQLSRNELILIELEKTELMDINGGKVAYWYSDDGTIVFFYNVAASIRNFFGD